MVCNRICSVVTDIIFSLKFDRVYPFDAPQEDVFFECILPLVQRLFEGEDGAVVVMGQPHTYGIASISQCNN